MEKLTDFIKSLSADSKIDDEALIALLCVMTEHTIKLEQQVFSLTETASIHSQVLKILIEKNKRLEVLIEDLIGMIKAAVEASKAEEAAKKDVH
jgi:hypothetical protein